MKPSKILLIAGIASVAIGVGFMVAGTILGFYGNRFLSDLFLGISSFLGVLALAVLIFRLVIQSKEEGPINPQKPKVVVKVVDVKDIPKTKEEKLYEQYEDLYKRNLISKEDLDLKRKEILGK